MNPDDMPFSKEKQIERSRGRAAYCDETGTKTLKRNCKGPRCRGRRNRRKGKQKQRKAIKLLNLKPPKWKGRAAHEETLTNAVRIEVKSGAKAGPIDTFYRNVREQSDAAKAIGDTRPFMGVAMPDGMSGGYAVIRLSDLAEVVEALVAEWEAAT